MLYAIELVQKCIDQKPPCSSPPDEYFLGGTAKEPSFEEAAKPPIQRTENRRRLRCSRRPVFKRSRRVTSLILLLVFVSLTGVLFFWDQIGRTGNESLERVVTPAVEEPPGATAEDPPAREEPTEEQDTEEEEEGAAAPDDPTLYLTVPRLGLYAHTVRNDDSEAALDLGAIKLPSTEFPWQEGDTNTYIACHRLGWSGNESFNQCLNLPSMRQGDKIILEDANKTVYDYRVVEILAVGPNDTWVTDPVAGKHVVSLQTCIENLDDVSTLGPNWEARFVVRAERTEEGGDFRVLVGDSIASYAGLVNVFYSRYGSVAQVAKKATGGIVARSLSGAVGPALPHLL
jgi:sortase A